MRPIPFLLTLFLATPAAAQILTPPEIAARTRPAVVRITGLAGALFADLNRFVSPTMFSWHMSGEIMIFIILGGVARLFGPVAGAVLFVAMEHVLGDLWDHWHILLGALLLVVVLFARGGLIGLLAGRARTHD